MGNWVNIWFHTRPLLVDEFLLRKVDACWAEIGFVPVKTHITYHPSSDGVEPADRLRALDEAKYWEPFGCPDDSMIGYDLGYADPRTRAETRPFHLSLLIWKSHRYATRFELMTHTDAYYFRSDTEVEEGDSDKLKREVGLDLERAAAARNIAPLLHETLGSYHTDARADEGSLFTLGGKRHTLSLFNGNPQDFSNTIDLYETQEGSWVCPVCSEASLAKSPWVPADDPEVPWAKPSIVTCPICRTHFGVDDKNPKQGEASPCWGELERKWLRSLPKPTTTNGESR